MSDRILRTASITPSAGVSKRTRKTSLRTTDDDKQRERKRALDRKAQRASREKTRSHIAQLEKMVKILSDKDGSPVTSELLEENSRLHEEIDRLKKIIDNIRSALGADAIGSVDAPRSHVPHRMEENIDPLLNQSAMSEADSPLDQAQVTGTPMSDKWEDRSPDDIAMEVGGETPENSIEIQSNSSREIDLDAHGIDGTTMALTSRWDGMKFPIFEHASLQSLAFPQIRTLEAPLPDFEPCKIWQKANSIYANIFKYSMDRKREANKVKAGSLIKVIKGGWGSLSLKERGNPVLQILQEVDQNLFWDLDPVTKIANLYKSLLLLKYYFNSEPDNLNRMPDWQQPVHSQKVRQHPVPIDFFPWPSLRDRLVRHHNYYFATTEFSVQYRLHFKFAWPFAFEDTYNIDPITKEYQISSLFDQYHRDMKCWSLEPEFFEKFPELIGEITVFEGDGESCSSTPDSIPDVSQSGATEIYTHTGHYSGFNNLMELFDDCPPT